MRPLARFIAALHLRAQLQRQHLGARVGFGLDQLAHQRIQLGRHGAVVQVSQPAENALGGRVPVHRFRRVRGLQRAHLPGIERQQIGRGARLRIDGRLDGLHQRVQTPMRRRVRGLTADAFFHQPRAGVDRVDVALDRFRIARIHRCRGQRRNVYRHLRKAPVRFVGQAAGTLQAPLVTPGALHELGRMLGALAGFLACAPFLVAPGRRIAPRLLARVRRLLLAIGLLIAPLLLGLIGAPGRVEQRRDQHVFDRDRSAHDPVR